jgi:hypothetical protein
MIHEADRAVAYMRNTAAPKNSPKPKRSLMNGGSTKTDCERKGDGKQ